MVVSSYILYLEFALNSSQDDLAPCHGYVQEIISILFVNIKSNFTHIRLFVRNEIANLKRFSLKLHEIIGETVPPLRSNLR